MSNKTQLQANNTTLDTLITRVNAAKDTVTSLPDAEPVLQDKTVTPTTSKQIVTADDEYDGLNVVTVNAMPTATQATPSITVSSAGKITASATQIAGYVSAGTKSATKQLTAKAATTYTPTTTNQTIAAGTYLSGAQTIKGDANLVAGNIKSGVSIFGVNGNYEGSGDSGSGSGGSGGSVETCTVTLNGAAGKSDNLVYHCVENGEVVCKSLYIPSFGYDSELLLTLGHDLSKVVKGSYLVFGVSTNTAVMSTVSMSGEVQLVGDNTQSGFTVGYIFKINGDCSISIS